MNSTVTYQCPCGANCKPIYRDGISPKRSDSCFEREISTLRKRLHEIHLEVDGYIDGAPDRSEASNLANRVQSIIDGNP